MTDALIEQLWGGQLSAGRLEMQVTGRNRSSVAENGWREVERYLVVPDARRPTMLLPAGPRPALLGALNNYRGLRTTRRQLQRGALSAAASLGRLPFSQVVLSVRADEPPGSRAHPVGELSAALGREDLRAAIGVRTGANRKATLQLVDVTGSPVGFAKFAWSEQTALAVQRETAALDADDRLGTCRRPALLASGTYSGWPYLVSSPLPLSSRGVRGRTAAPTVQEFHDLAPVAGRRPLAGSRHFLDLVERLEKLTSTGSPAPLVERTLQLLASAAADGRDFVMSAHWHGDLTPWNTARDSEGQLWCWDWESSESDALAGMDAIHWHLSLVQESGRPLTSEALRCAAAAAEPVLTGLGHAPWAKPVVAAVYVGALVERAIALSVAEGGWEAGWLTAEDLEDLVSHALQELRARPLTTS
jgi:hypothetical protein